jgi:hypothetical protein
MKGQISLEALVAVSAFLAFILVLLYSFIGLQGKADDFSERMAARSCAAETAELAGYYSLDGKGSDFLLLVKEAIGIDGEVHCRRGRYNESAKALAGGSNKEPI